MCCQVGDTRFADSQVPSRFNIPDSNCTVLNSAHIPGLHAYSRGRAFRAKAVLIEISTLLPRWCPCPYVLRATPSSTLPSGFCV